MAGGPSKAAVAAARVALRRTHIRRRTPSEKIFTRWREDVHDLGVFGEKTFVLDVAGNNGNIAPDHRTPLVFVIDTLPRQLLKRAEPRHQRHDVRSVALPGTL